MTTRRSFLFSASAMTIAPAAAIATPQTPAPEIPTVPIGSIMERVKHYVAEPAMGFGPSRAVAVIEQVIWDGGQWLPLDSDAGRDLLAKLTRAARPLSEWERHKRSLMQRIADG